MPRDGFGGGRREDGTTRIVCVSQKGRKSTATFADSYYARRRTCGGREGEREGAAVTVT